MIKIIAEAGVNHNGDMDLAKKLIEAARHAGADYVKFQTFRAEKLASRYAEKAAYQKKTTGQEQSQVTMLKSLELSQDQFRELADYASFQGIEFLSTPFDLESIQFLSQIAMPFWKIPSGEITNLPYLVEIAKTGKPVVLSTGMSTLKEIKDAVALLEQNGTPQITLLHCNTQYPTPYEDVNLLAMRQIAEETGCPVGYSDHTLGIQIPIAAAALGACIIEKHFTLDRNLPGPDHKASLEPGQLKEMVESVHLVEKALGDGKKRPSPSEQDNIAVARKSIVAARPIQKGERFTSMNLTTKRPGNGLSPMRWREVLEKTACRDFAEDELIEI